MIQILKRSRQLNNIEYNSGDVVFWMSRDQRVNDNWALLYTQELANKYNVKFLVIFCLVPNFLEATIRQYDFMLKGLQQTATELQKKNIPFHLLSGDPATEIPEFVKDYGMLITDFDPLKIKKLWKKKISESINIPFYEVDTHNIVPCWIASNKQEYGARTIRPKIKKLLPEYLDEFPELEKQKNNFDIPSINWSELRKILKVDFSVKEVHWPKPGEKEALNTLNYFINHKLDRYDTERNDPNQDAVSNLSPYLHFGKISAQRIALEIYKSGSSDDAKETFLEELIIRKELSDNFCYYNENYDSINSFPDWARKTLKEHEEDIREYIYPLESFELAQTHDDLWNAAQNQMVNTGKMHGYMRMYWCKKILEWIETPEEAMKIAIYLNDKYQLDGRDPNGYTGIAWSIGGVHDRAWFERDIFGKIRYMNYNGCKSKFDVKQYIQKNL
ncbi:deoxyribodipyrimidine photo-lyase [Calditrichota bacterium]